MSLPSDPFFTQTEERNFCIIVQGQNIYVHKELLISMSPVFHRMIYGCFKEANENSVELKEKRWIDVLELFHVLFPIPHVRAPITQRNIELMTKFADEYDIEQLRVDIKSYLQSNLESLTVGNVDVVRIAKCASDLRFIGIVESCIPYLCKLGKIDTCPLPKNVLAAVYQANWNRWANNSHLFTPLVKCKFYDPQSHHKSEFQCHPKGYGCLNCKHCMLHLDSFSCPSRHDRNCSNRFSDGAVVDCNCGFTFNKELLK